VREHAVGPTGDHPDPQPGSDAGAGERAVVRLGRDVEPVEEPVPVQGLFEQVPIVGISVADDQRVGDQVGQPQPRRGGKWVAGGIRARLSIG
jgi:hypothetical protein